MSDKKRKSVSKDSDRPSKKHQTALQVQVSHVAGPDVTKPVIASSNSTIFPDVTFQSFARPNGKKTSLLLHSSKHSTLDHTAREDDSSIDNHLKHFIAVFDPETGKLQITEAKHLTVRSALRSAHTDQEDGQVEGNGVAATSNPMSRRGLTEAFGTKKSKKAAQSAAENRSLTQGNEDVEDPVSTNMLSKVEEDDETKPEISLMDTLSNKPLPPANLEASEIDQVYSLDTLVVPYPSAPTLETMVVNTWVARISAKKEIESRFRFVAHRAGYLAHKLLKTPDASDQNLQRALQVLRYIQLLLDLHSYVTRLNKRRPIPPVDKWPEQTMSEGTPLSLLRPILHHFFPDRTPKEQSVTLLRTTILALTLHIPPPSSGKSRKGRLVTEITDISLDMAIDSNELRKLYRELGCAKVGPATEQDTEGWGFGKLVKQRKDAAGGSLPKLSFALLKFPLEFPKRSAGRSAARR